MRRPLDGREGCVAQGDQVAGRRAERVDRRVEVDGRAVDNPEGGGGGQADGLVDGVGDRVDRVDGEVAYLVDGGGHETEALYR